MPGFENHFVWCDLTTSDVAAATAFYKDVVGWNVANAGMPDRDYFILSAGTTGIGGLMGTAPGCEGSHPIWTGYVGVSDVDATAARIIASGGAIQHGPEDIPGVGRFAVVADPQGAVFNIFRGSAGMPAPEKSPDAPGQVGWNELRATEWQAAFAFYAEMFGWTKGDAIDMGPMGTYQLFIAGDAAIGGMMTKPPQIPVASWLIYFNVPDIDVAVARVGERGGQVIHGPVVVPGGQRVAQCFDPQGASFGIVAPA